MKACISKRVVGVLFVLFLCIVIPGNPVQANQYGTADNLKDCFNADISINANDADTNMRIHMISDTSASIWESLPIDTRAAILDQLQCADHRPTSITASQPGAYFYTNWSNYPMTIEPLLTWEAKPLNSTATAYEYFSCSVSGDTIVVGALSITNDRGAAYVFERNQGEVGNWVKVKKLTSPAKLFLSDGVTSSANDLFGAFVSISGDTIVVSAHCDDDKGECSGAAYVFERNQGGVDNWGEVKKLTASDGAANDYFGSSVSASDNIIVVGASKCDGTVYVSDYAGAAYVFECNQGGANSWGEVKQLPSSVGICGNERSCVSVSGDTVVVGSSLSYNCKGAAHVFKRNQGGSGNWGKVEELTAADGWENDRFAYSVAISDDTIVIGAPFDDENGLNSGSAYLFYIQCLQDGEIDDDTLNIPPPLNMLPPSENTLSEIEDDDATNKVSLLIMPLIALAVAIIVGGIYLFRRRISRQL
ncbi:hypothetical protein ACFLWX_04320 [Chloroflexota bacterium]